MSVDKSCAPIQTFEFATVDELQSWLGELSHDATAASPDLDAITADASRVLTLVTCSSVRGGEGEDAFGLRRVIDQQPRHGLPGQLKESAIAPFLMSPSDVAHIIGYLHYFRKLVQHVVQA